MDSNFKEILEQVSEQVKSMANTKTVIGEEFELGEYKCKPVIKVGLGFGSGSGQVQGSHHQKFKNKGDGNGTGAGGGVGIAPVGFLVSKGDEIQFISSGAKGGLSTLFEKMPEMMEKCMDYCNDKDSKKTATKES